MTLRGLPCNPLLFSGSHYLPLAGIDLSLPPILERRGFGDEQIGIFCELGEGIAGASIPGEYNHPVRRLKAIRVGLVFAGCGTFMEIEMGVLDSQHFNVRVLVNNYGTDIV